MAVPANEEFDIEVGTFIKEICTDLSRMESAAAAGCELGSVSVEREVPLINRFGDIRVAAPGQPAFFLENKLKYSPSELVSRIRSKYGETGPFGAGADRVAVLVDPQAVSEWPKAEASLRKALAPGLALDVWDAGGLLERIRVTFDCDVPDLTHASLRRARQAIERAQWRTAFDGEFSDYSAAGALLWHFSAWELRRLHLDMGLAPGEVLERAAYEDVIVVMADLCSFSSYVRDTPNPRQIRRRLSDFYSLARHAVLNAGGMLYQFVGDEVVALFGIHEPSEVAAAQALRCARSLFDAGNSVSYAWQRHLDRVQPSRGVHIGIAAGNLNVLPLRPFSRTHIGFIGDGLNMAARLMGQAQSRQVVVSNRFYALLDPWHQAAFEEIEPIDARNVGRIGAFRATQDSLLAADGQRSSGSAEDVDSKPARSTTE